MATRDQYVSRATLAAIQRAERTAGVEQSTWTGRAVRQDREIGVARPTRGREDGEHGSLLQTGDDQG